MSVRQSSKKASQPFLLSPFVLAELDYLLARYVGPDAQIAVLGEVARGAHQLQSFEAPDVARAGEIAGKYRDLEIGLADASIVVRAERHEVYEPLTLDPRPFRAMRFGGGRGFKLLPFQR